MSEASCIRILSIGVYGFSEASFFEALQRARVDVLCDIRLRRGLRGPLYRFANSSYLQKHLAELGIRYVHAKELAPDDAIRALQWAEDKATGVGKRERTVLSPAFIGAYKSRRMVDFDAAAFLRKIAPDARAFCFLCVEREPGACHRSLVCGQIAADLGTTIEDLMP